MCPKRLRRRPEIIYASDGDSAQEREDVGVGDEVIPADSHNYQTQTFGVKALWCSFKSSDRKVHVSAATRRTDRRSVRFMRILIRRVDPVQRVHGGGCQADTSFCM